MREGWTLVNTAPTAMKTTPNSARLLDIPPAADVAHDDGIGDSSRGCSPVGNPTRRQCPAVLVIDDDPLVRMVIEAALESFGEFEIWTASDGATGLSLVEAARPDYMFLDLLIPGKNGFAVLEELQGRGTAFAGMRVIVTSGLMGPSTLERLAALGDPEILPKPFRLQDLREIVIGSPEGSAVAAG